MSTKFSSPKVEKQPKILIVADYLPEGGAGGGVIMRDLLESYPSNKINWFALEGPVNYKPNWRTDIKRCYIPFWLPGRYRNIYNKLKVRFLERFLNKIQYSKFRRIIKKFKPDKLWFIVQKRTIIFQSEIVKAFPKIPVHISIHDDPLLENKYSNTPYAAPFFYRNLKTIMNHAVSVDSVSQRLLNKYCNSNQKQAIVTRGIHKNAINKFFTPQKVISDEIRIVLAGMGQCPPPWPQNLISAINLLQNGKQHIKFFSFDFTFPADNKHFFVEPIVPPDEFDKMLQTFHIGYICDPMNEYGKEFARTSFSTKLVTYVTRGLPFLYHGPKDSTTTDFLNKYKCGLVVESNDPAEIANGFKSLINNFKSFQKECLRASKEALTLTHLKNRFYEVII
jgi:glycosyltransferase involved in cell wall biosynthesis